MTLRIPALPPVPVFNTLEEARSYISVFYQSHVALLEALSTWQPIIQNIGSATAVTGSRDANAALASLLTALDGKDFIDDQTTA